VNETEYMDVLLDSRLRGDDKLRLPKGRAEGRSPYAFLIIPQEWGIKGAEASLSAL